VLDRVAPFFDPPTDALEALYESRRRRELGRRVAAGALGLVITALLITFAIRSTDRSVPADRPDRPATVDRLMDTDTIGGESWTLSARVESDLGPDLGPVISLSTSTATSGGGGDELRLVDVELPGSVAVSYQVSLPGIHSFVLGYVGSDVSEVVVDFDGVSRSVELSDVPFALEHPLRAFVIPVDGGPVGSLTTLDDAGAELLSVGLAPGTKCGPDRTEPGVIDTSQVCRDIGDDSIVFEGVNWLDDVEVSWRIVRRGDGLVMLDDDDAVLGRLAGTTGPLAVTSADVQLPSSPFVFGVASGDLTNVALAGRRGGDPYSRTQRTRVLADGRVAFVGDFVPSYDHPTQLVGFERNCEAILAIDIRTFQPVEAAAEACGMQPARGR
jgi:hypothetical protein